jgi:DNA replication protein DnaC
MRVNEVIEKLETFHEIKIVRQPKSFSFGTEDRCREIFENVFRQVDKTVTTFKMLPEYHEIIDWMQDTKGKGLCLTGDVGRGKSTILASVIPVIMYGQFKLVVRPTQSVELPSNINNVTASAIVCLDDVGIENLINDFGEKYEGFNRVMDAAESRMKLVFLSTNLTPEMMLERYGERTMERVLRLCRLVKFTGDSLRK